ALAGGLLGLLASTWMTRGLVRLLPFDPANISLSTAPDTRLLIFTAAVTLLTAVLFGLAPALQSSWVSPAVAMKGEAGSLAGGRGHTRLRKAFVALQVGLSCLLLIGAGLFARTFQNLHSTGIGFYTEDVVMFGVRPAIAYDGPRKLRVLRA